jgi:hypothetical protein
MKHTEDNLITDTALEALFLGKENGLSFPQALLQAGLPSLSQEETRIAKELWDMHGELTREAHALSPRPELLHHILEQLPRASISPVTEAVPSGYMEYGAKSPLTRNMNFLMQMNWRIATPLAVLVLVVVTTMNLSTTPDAGELAMNVNNPESATMAMMVDEGAPSAKSRMAQPPETGTMMAMQATDSFASAPTGSIDDLAASIVIEADADYAMFNDADDSYLLTLDDAEINSFMTAYDETTF